MTKDTFALLKGRSGLAFRSNIVAFDGTIDSDYRGVVKVLLFNHSKVDFKINYGDRIAQLIFQKLDTVQFINVETLTASVRDQGGFGSSGL